MTMVLVACTFVAFALVANYAAFVYLWMRLRQTRREAHETRKLGEFLYDEQKARKRQVRAAASDVRKKLMADMELRRLRIDDDLPPGLAVRNDEPSLDSRNESAA